MARSDLIAQRMAEDPGVRAAWGAAIEKRLMGLLASEPPSLLGIYWPMRGEFDPRPLAIGLLKRGWQAAMPVVTVPKSPLEFRPWTADCAMESGVWDIPGPRDGPAVRPDILLAPVVGFDARRYRLGYGGGYFDRTLAALKPQPVAIGVGFEFQKLPSIHPGEFDIPMDLIVTETTLY